MLKSYLICIMTVSVIVGLTTSFYKPRSPGAQRAMQLVGSLVMLVVLLTPFAGLNLSSLADTAGESLLEVLSTGKNTTLDAAARESLRAGSAQALADAAQSEICSRTNLSANSITIAFTLGDNESGEFFIEQISVTLRTFTAISKRDTINAALLALFGGSAKINYIEAVL